MKKSILFITYSLKLGGTTTTLLDTVRLINRDKYDVTVFTIHDGGTWETKFRDEGVPVVNSYSQMLQGVSLRTKIANRIKLHKIEYMRKQQGRGLIEYCVGRKFDLVVMHHSYEPYELAPFIPGAATVRYIHGDLKNNARYRGVLDQVSEHFGKYDKIICVSKVAQESFTEVYGHEEKTKVCYNPIDSDKIITKSLEKIDIEINEPYICAVGRLAPEKGFVRLIEIHDRILKTGVRHNLVIIGDGPERNKIEKIIKDRGLRESVILVGYTDNPYPYIRNSLFTVCPSYSEGLHMVSMESLCLGVPVVAAVKPVQELFGQECCGVITENDDDSLEAGIIKMLKDEDYYYLAKRGANNRSSAFSSQRMILDVEQIYDAVIEGKE